MLKRSSLHNFQEGNYHIITENSWRNFKFRVRKIQSKIRKNTIRFSCMVSRKNLITKWHMQNEIYNDLETFRNRWKLKLLQKPTKTKIPPLQITAAIIIPKSKVYIIHIWCHHSETLSTTSDKKTNSDNSISINVIPSKYFNWRSTAWSEIRKKCPV